VLNFLRNGLMYNFFACLTVHCVVGMKTSRNEILARRNDAICSACGGA
jgi:hypothetical protein